MHVIMSQEMFTIKVFHCRPFWGEIWMCRWVSQNHLESTMTPRNCALHHLCHPLVVMLIIMVCPMYAAPITLRIVLRKLACNSGGVTMCSSLLLRRVMRKMRSHKRIRSHKRKGLWRMRMRISTATKTSRKMKTNMKCQSHSQDRKGSQYGISLVKAS
jgi:hypothetical protein